MPITFSEITSDDVQADGRRHVRERHLDHVTVEHIVSYLCSAEWDADAAMTARKPGLEAALRDAEISENIAEASRDGKFATIKLVYSTVQESGIAVRAAYKTMVDRDAIMCGDFLNTLTDAQLQNAFAMTPAQVTNLRNNKLIPSAQQADTLRAATGV